MVRDEPGRFWALGAFFILIGVLAVAAAVAGRRDVGPVPAVVGAAFGCVAVAAGLSFAGRAPRSTIVVRPAQGELAVERRGLFGRKRERFELGPFLQARLGRATDRDGDPVYRLVADFHGVGEVCLSMLWLHDTRGLQLAAQVINQYARAGVKAAS